MPLSAMNTNTSAPITTSDAIRLIEALRSLDNTLRAGVGSPNKPEAQLARRSSTVHITQVPIGDATGGNINGIKRSEKISVETRVVFLKIGEIDTQKEKYTADVFLQAKWREPKHDGNVNLTAEDLDWDQQWTPKLYIDNILGEAKVSVWYLLSFDDQDHCTVTEKHRYTGSYLETLELNRFPFDTQDLTVTVTSERTEQELELVEDEKELCGVNVQSFKDEQEWRLHSHVETWRKVTTKIFQNAKFKHPAICVACKASRRPGFFVWNIFFVMLFIASLAFSTFAVDLSLPQNRLQLSFILLLTTVTFKFIVNQNLPRISYLTYLDKYILITMSILCTVCAWHSLVTIVLAKTSQETAEFADMIVLVVMATIFVLFHMVFIFWIIAVNKMTRRNLGKKEEEHENRQKVLEDITEGSQTQGSQDSARSPRPPSKGNPSSLLSDASAAASKNGTEAFPGKHHNVSKITPSFGVILEDA